MAPERPTVLGEMTRWYRDPDWQKRQDEAFDRDIRPLLDGKLRELPEARHKGGNSDGR